MKNQNVLMKLNRLQIMTLNMNQNLRLFVTPDVINIVDNCVEVTQFSQAEVAVFVIFFALEQYCNVNGF